jgi:hypothetical protein
MAIFNEHALGRYWLAAKFGHEITGKERKIDMAPAGLRQNFAFLTPFLP